MWAWRAGEQEVDTYVWSADGEVSIDGHHRQQANAGHAEEDVESCIDLVAKNTDITNNIV